MSQEKRVLILGAGTVGRALAGHYLAKGCSVVLCDENQEELEAALKQVVGAVGVPTEDLKDTQQVRRAVCAATDLMGGLDGYIHTLGAPGFVPFEAMDYARWRGTRERCLDVSFVWGQQVGKKLRDLGGGGFMLYVIGDGCYGQDPNEIARCAAQWGIKGLVRSMAVSLGRYGITVNAVCTGAMDTPEDEARRSALSAYLGLDPAELRRRQEGETLTGRIQSVDEVAGLCAFLTWEAINVSGQALLLDGGACFN